MARDVFVSYSHPNQECALELVSRIEADGLSAWVAPRDIAPSADWAAEIIEGISQARLMVLVLSSHSNASPQVLREVERAVHKRVPILTFRIENVVPTRSLEYFISAQHWLDAFPPPWEPHFDRLCAHLVAQLSGTAAQPSFEPQLIRGTPAARHSEPVFTMSATELQLLEQQLTHHIGPVAKYLVKRAAAKTKGREELTQQLAAEIESDLARRQFIDACGTLGRPHD